MYRDTGCNQCAACTIGYATCSVHNVKWWRYALSICYDCCTNKFRQRSCWGEHCVYMYSSTTRGKKIIMFYMHVYSHILPQHNINYTRHVGPVSLLNQYRIPFDVRSGDNPPKALMWLKTPPTPWLSFIYIISWRMVGENSEFGWLTIKLRRAKYGKTLVETIAMSINSVGSQGSNTCGCS